MQPNVFSALDIDIDGTNLIEASAGTGKTWSIAALFLRLVMIERIAVDRILVVTFTNAATAELKTRLRARLDDALQELQNITDGEEALKQLQDAFENRPVKRQLSPNLPEFEEFLYQSLSIALKQETASRLRLRLQAAINQFDHAGIFTIHGFCQRVLREFAFLCQVPFQVTLADDTSLAQQRLAADFWRQNVMNNAQLARLCLEHKLTPQNALQSIRSWFARPNLQFQLSQSELNLDEIQQALDLACTDITEQLPKLIELFWNIHPQLNGNSYRKATFEALFTRIISFKKRQDWQGLDKDSLARLMRLSSEDLIANTKKTAKPLTEEQSLGFASLIEIPTLIEQQKTAQQALFDALHHDLWQHLQQHWPQEKQRLQQLGFDDLLTDVALALQDQRYGSALASRISEQMWQVALIDEFQDTDPLQYGIFNRIFREHGKPVFLVGDPKQAIYRFRGADIHAYLQAKEDADRHYTLDTNRRTHQTLVRSINQLFLNKQQPFLLDNIDYIDVAAAREHSRLRPNDTPLEIQWLMHEHEDKLNKDQARERSADYCAADIARHLALSAQGLLHYKDQALQAKHIAVLVRTHHEGEMVRQALRQNHHISSVILSRDSVFTSAHAKPVLTLLQWWLSPQQQGLLRSVLTSELLCYRSSDLMRLNDVNHQDELIAWMEDALAAQQLWRQRGIYAAWQMFDRKRGISADFLRRGDKRGLTNVQQLFELLAHEASERFGAESLMQWLSERIADERSTEASSLRLESDEELVKIVTMHASKGLQYPIVFCPFIWDSRKFKTADFNLVHDDHGQVSVVSAACLSEEDRLRLERDDLSESLRLFYVAFTRAEEKLVLSSCLIEDSQYNVLNYLLTPPHNASLSDVETHWKTLPKADTKMDDAAKAAVAKQRQQWYQQLWQDWASANHVALAWHANKPEYAGLVQAAIELPQFQAATATLPYYRLHEYTSFSGMARHINHQVLEELTPELDSAELQDALLAPEAEETADEEYSIFQFQRGTEAGLCLHALLEETDFGQAAATQMERYAPILEQYQIAPEWYAALMQMIDDTRLCLLDDEVCLADIPHGRMLAEMGFVLRVDDFNADDIRKWLQNSSLPVNIRSAIQGITFRDVAGFLNGFIDLTCVSLNNQVYVIDYKSNHLGARTQDYQTPNLDRAITEHRYYLQALIYALAVERYLQTRQMQVDAIHIRYLFLRGLKAHRKQGIWRWDIEQEQLEKLTPNLLRDNISVV